MSILVLILAYIILCILGRAFSRNLAKDLEKMRREAAAAEKERTSVRNFTPPDLMKAYEKACHDIDQLVAISYPGGTWDFLQPNIGQAFLIKNSSFMIRIKALTGNDFRRVLLENKRVIGLQKKENDIEISNEEKAARFFDNNFKRLLNIAEKKGQVVLKSDEYDHEIINELRMKCMDYGFSSSNVLNGDLYLYIY